ncbi:TonB-dependent hemoglobin/transferrin/lactoferrin family receptor [Tistrella arctica]
MKRRQLANRLGHGLVALCMAAPGVALSAPPVEGAGAGSREEREDEAAGGAAEALPAISVIATRGARAVDEIPANVTVIGREELDLRMVDDIGELVRHLPGIQVDRQTSGTNPFADRTGFTIRGVSGNRILTLVDGSRTLERITDGTRDVVDLTHMKRVEIQRGPASALWGSDALGGVVAFETMDPEDYLAQSGRDTAFRFDTTHSTLDSSTGGVGAAALRYGDIAASISLGRRVGHEPENRNARGSLAAGAVWECYRNVGATPCGQLDSADIRSDNALGKLVWTPGDNHRIGLTLETFERKTEVDQRYDYGLDTSGNTVTDYDRTQTLSRQRIGLEHDWTVEFGPIDQIRWQLSHSPQKSKREGARDRILANGTTETRYDLLEYEEAFTEFDVQVDGDFDTAGISHHLTWGFDGDYTEGEYERVDTTVNHTTGTTTVARAGGFNFANATTIRADAYIQDDIGFMDGRLRVTPAMRLAHYSIDPDPNADYKPVDGAEPRKITKTEPTWKLGAVYDLDRNFSVYGQYAEGFKMPTAQQLYTSLPSTFFNLVPNPDLQPESVKNYEAGLRGRFRDGNFSVGGFYADYTDFIQSFVMLSNGDITYDNLSTVKVWGLEASGELYLDEIWSVSGALSAQRGEQVASPGEATTAFNGAIPLGSTLGLHYDDQDMGLRASLYGTFQRGVTRTESDASYKPAGYGVFDFAAAWQPMHWVTLRLGIDNIFDKRYFPSSAVAYDATPSTTAVANTNPIEAQVQPGRSFSLGATLTF